MNHKTTPKRFVAGARCPECQQMDTTVCYYEDEVFVRECIECDFLERITDNEAEGKEPITFDHDCREGICGSCGFVINGQPHGHKARTTTCQLHMRSFNDGDVITIEPFRAGAFPVIIAGASFAVACTEAP